MRTHLFSKSIGRLLQAGKPDSALAAGLVALLVVPAAAEAGPFEKLLEVRPSAQKTRFVTIRNEGPVGVRSPRVVIGSQPDTASLEAIVGSVTSPAMSEREKAEALWKFVTSRSVHACPSVAFPGRVTYGPIAVLNELGYGCCDQVAPALGALWRTAGLRSRLAQMKFHTVPEVFYEDDWHLYDPDHRVYYLLEDGHKVASVWRLACAPTRVASVPDPVGFDSAWMASKYESDGPNARYFDVDHSFQAADYWLPAGSSLTFSETPQKLKRQDLRPLEGDDEGPDFSEAVFLGTARFDDPSWPVFLRGTEVRDGRLRLRAGATRATAVLGVAGPGAALKGSLEIPYVVRSGGRLSIRISGDSDLPGGVLAEIAGPASGRLRTSLEPFLRSIRERRFYVILELEGAEPSAVEVGPSIGIETVMQWSHLALRALGEPIAKVRYRDDSGDVSRNLRVVVGGRTLPVTTPGGSDFWEWETSADDGRAIWRSYLSKPGEEVRKTLSIPEGALPGMCGLLSLVSGTAKDEKKASFSAVFSVDGTEVGRVLSPEIEGIRWYRVDLGKDLLAGKKQIDVRISLVGDPQDAAGYVEVFGSKPDFGQSWFNGSQTDFSPDPEMQRGEFLIRLRCSGPPK